MTWRSRSSAFRFPNWTSVCGEYIFHGGLIWLRCADSSGTVISTSREIIAKRIIARVRPARTVCVLLVIDLPKSCIPLLYDDGNELRDYFTTTAGKEKS